MCRVCERASSALLLGVLMRRPPTCVHPPTGPTMRCPVARSSHSTIVSRSGCHLLSGQARKGEVRTHTHGRTQAQHTRIAILFSNGARRRRERRHPRVKRSTEDAVDAAGARAAALVERRRKDAKIDAQRGNTDKKGLTRFCCCFACVFQTIVRPSNPVFTFVAVEKKKSGRGSCHGRSSRC